MEAEKHSGRRFGSLKKLERWMTGTVVTSHLADVHTDHG